MESSRYGEEDKEVVSHMEPIVAEEHVPDPPMDIYSKSARTVEELFPSPGRSKIRRLNQQKAAMVGVPTMMDVQSMIVMEIAEFDEHQLLPQICKQIDENMKELVWKEELDTELDNNVRTTLQKKELATQFASGLLKDSSLLNCQHGVQRSK